jgi:acyl dehydratase
MSGSERPGGEPAEERDWDEVCARLRARVGERTVLALGRMSALHFQRFALATGDANPRYLDEEAARAQGFPGVVAPPLLLSAVMRFDAGPPEAGLRADGASTEEELASLPLAGLRLMGAGQDLEFVEPVVDGAEVSMEVTVEDVELKRARSGPMLLIRLSRRYRDQRGVELVRCRETFFAR